MGVNKNDSSNSNTVASNIQKGDIPEKVEEQ